MALDPISSICNAIVALCSLAEKILDTMPAEIHANNWAFWVRVGDSINSLASRIAAVDLPDVPEP